MIEIIRFVWGMDMVGGWVMLGAGGGVFKYPRQRHNRMVIGGRLHFGSREHACGGGKDFLDDGRRTTYSFVSIDYKRSVVSK